MLTAIIGGLFHRTSAAARDPNWEGWNSIGGTSRASTGERVTVDKALMLAAVWQSVSMISGDAAKLPLDLYRKAGVDGSDREVARDHDAYWLVRRQANDQPMTAGQLWRQLMGDALIWNNAYAWISYHNGRPVAIVPLLPDRTCAEFLPDGRLVYVSEIGDMLKPMVFDPLEIIHIRGLMLTRQDGSAPSLLQAARDVIGVGLAAQKYQAKFFKNGMRTSGILELPAGMTKLARDKVETQFRSAHEGEDSWFKTVVLREGAKFQQVSQSNQQGETHLLREDQVREVARLFNLPPSKLGLSDSVAYNSKSEDNRAYLDTTLAPWLCMIAEECWLKLLSPAERRMEDLYFEHNTASLLRMDLATRYQAYQVGIQSGFLMKSEARKFENMAAIPGIDDAAEVVEDDLPMLEPPEDDGDDEPGAEMPQRWATYDADEWLSDAKRNRPWKQLVVDYRHEALARGWQPLLYEAIRKRVKRHRDYLVAVSRTSLST